MSADAADENDPEIQRNAFDLYADQFGIPHDVAETFIDEHFDPDDPFDVNNRRWWRWFAEAADDVVNECPHCGAEIEATIGLDADGDEAATKAEVRALYIEPCGDVLRVN